jgi:EAL domain-containing protein (putative c-di-GMP-specific phosphodiesterase class I)
MIVTINPFVRTLSMIETLTKRNIYTVIDDVCNPQSMISTSVIQLVSYIKLDKYVIDNKSNRNFMLLVKSIIDYAHGAGTKVILEGIETTFDLHLAKQLQVD